MARLIDAEKLNFHCNYNGDCSGDVSHCKECGNYVLDYRDIQEQPTSYDTDKVVEQLNDKFRVVRTDEDLKWNRAMDDAITIVEEGGVDG